MEEKEVENVFKKYYDWCPLDDGKNITDVLSEIFHMIGPAGLVGEYYHIVVDHFEQSNMAIARFLSSDQQRRIYDQLKHDLLVKLQKIFEPYQENEWFLKIKEKA